MNSQFQSVILNSTGAEKLFELEEIQSLWSGYGKIIRYGLKNANYDSVVVKHINLQKDGKNSKRLQSDLSHQRKLKSYKVEMAWYKNWSKLCDSNSRVPHVLAMESSKDEILIVLEDLDNSGYAKRKTILTDSGIKACLNWLANFHSTFMGQHSSDLWKIGTYWHLDTRPDELKVLKDVALKSAAKGIDKKLNSARFKTFVHGDAKLANFCFSKDGRDVAAVDFQYVGSGCGMKDVAYFMSSCLHEEECEKMETQLLDYYFDVLKKALINKQVAIDFNDLEEEWRELYPFAWTDFYRFLKGWTSVRWGDNSYSEKLAKQVIKSLGNK
ncbi:MAG: DUF1679 domain-containing protein [Leptospiraceae bacterium]|nr:DUF1679 domain-containing protein [Leptospiraceae bacterium]MCP5495437.1 DUF1679 domain-containing protein [Leptospiraceae bacterium]